MRKILMVALTVLLSLTACAPNLQKQEEVVQENEDTKQKAIIPKYQISDQYYRTILPFEPSQARGLIVNNLNTRYDISEFETGLMRLAQTSFGPDKYLFKEGQNLDRETVGLWLNRKMTATQLQDAGLKENENIGLNPQIPEGGDIAANNEQNPIYLAHLLEHNYLLKDEDGTVRLGGVVIGLALNSVHYYQKEAYGATFESEISQAKLEEEGKRIAAEVLTRLRGMKSLANVPITIALFKQKSRSSVVPGNFIAYASADKGSSKLGAWQSVNENYFLFPSTEATNAHRDDVTFFLNFKQDVETYFPNFNGVIGQAFYVGDQLQELKIDIPIQFYGKAEAVGFTQYVTGLVMEHFPDYYSVEVNITSVNGQEGLIVKEAGDKEPFVHIYQ
ncbi:MULTISPECIES: CamS family sex pheromone protein [Robertmurraya]|uniref:CamS family sex pheromone protein n=1 Tax=Robertmurraya beringensis TaxID=641660 RepID=A0ABV6KVM4_9BACI